MKSFSAFTDCVTLVNGINWMNQQEAFGDKHQGHDVDNGPKKSEKKMKGKKTVALKGGTSVTTMPKTPEGPDKALGVKEGCDDPVKTYRGSSKKKNKKK